MINTLLGKTGKNERVAHSGDGTCAVTQVTQEYVQASSGHQALSSVITFYNEESLAGRLADYVNKIVEYTNLDPDDDQYEEFSQVVSYSFTAWERLSGMFPQVTWLKTWPTTKAYLKPTLPDGVQLLVKDFMRLTKECQAVNGVDAGACHKVLIASTLSELRTKIKHFTEPGLLSWTVEKVRYAPNQFPGRSPSYQANTMIELRWTLIFSAVASR